jgi:cell division septum initiation protein DivIVA
MSKETLEQKVERLEKELKAFRSETTIAQSYIALKQYVDENNKLLSTIKITKINVQDKDDKLVERSAKFSSEILNYIKRLAELEKMVTIEVINEEKKTFGSILEEALTNDEKK